MKVVVAIDSLKGSLSSMEAGLAIKAGILEADKTAEVIIKPLADGGEGTTDSLVEGLGGEKKYVDVMGPLGLPVRAYYGYLKQTRTAIIEMASAAGITLMAEKDRNPFKATTYGVGELILDAVKLGCLDFIIGIGGSATNDGGVGMLQALGFEFLDKDGNKIGYGAGELGKIARINDKKVNKELKNCHFRVACDVNNPLCGKNGAAYVYGPQKGVSDDKMEALDLSMAHYADITNEYLGKDYRNYPGAGAAGGLGYAFLSYLPASLESGISLILKEIKLEENLADADYVITGEGRLDFQTAMGKAPIGVAKLAKKYGAKVIAFAGSVTGDANKCNEEGIDAFFPIVRGVTTLEEAMNPAAARKNMAACAEQVFRLIRA